MLHILNIYVSILIFFTYGFQLSLILELMKHIIKLLMHSPLFCSSFFTLFNK